MRKLAIALLGVVAVFRVLLTPASRLRPDTVTTPSHPVPRFIVRHPWLSLAALMATLGVGGGVLVVSGVVPITASAGHWAITEWFLYFAMRRSIATHSALITPPALDDPTLVLRGAGHYELGCRPCHGAPGTGLPAIPSGMTPHPPALSQVIPRWESEDLFYIVKHGVKMTGMPSWPAQQRDDEVWAMVAFLRTLPELDARAYERLVRGDITTIAELAPVAPSGTDTEPPRVVVEICARCHGLDGTGRGVGAFPRLGGQRERYLANALQAYARKERFSGIMGPIAAALPESAVADVSKYYAGMAAQTGQLQGPGAPVARDPSAFAQGAVIATRGVASQDIPSCADCHGPAPRNPAYPILSGQYADYLVLQLELLQARRRGGSPYVRLMHAFVDRLSAEQIRAVASYYSSQTRQSPTSLPR